MTLAEKLRAKVYDAVAPHGSFTISHEQLAMFADDCARLALEHAAEIAKAESEGWALGGMVKAEWLINAIRAEAAKLGAP